MKKVKMNYFKRTNFAIIIFIFLLFFINSSICLCKAKDGNILYVGGSGSGNFTSIQEAIDNSSENDSIFVYDGTYSESIVVINSIDLIGENKESVILDNNNQFYTFFIQSKNVNISGFNIKNSQIGIYITNLGMGEINISENVFSENNEGIRIYNSTNIKITNNIIINNSEFGIVTSKTENIEIVKNVIIQNYRGIYLGRSSNYNMIDNNNCSDNIFGLYLKFSLLNNIKNNELYNNLWGVYLIDSNNNSITENYIQNNADGGISLEKSDGNIVEPNFFYNNPIDIREKSKPPSIKAPGFQFIILMIGLILIFYYKKILL
jgi:parallel beta-helix repeat protein